MFWFNKKKGIYKAPDGSRFSPAAPPSRHDLKKAEIALGFSLPIPLVDLYLTYGNGGFGPGYGVIGIEGGHKDTGLSLVGRYKEQLSLYSDEDDEPWPRGLLPICHYGCGLYSCVMTFEEGSPVYRWTCDEFADLEVYRFEGLEIKLESETLESWFLSWRDFENPIGSD